MSLQNMPFAKRLEVMERIAGVIVDVLVERGPLNREALMLYTQREWKSQGYGWLSSDDLRVTLLAASTSGRQGDTALDRILHDSNSFLYSAARVDGDGVAPALLPAPRDYVEAFYDLFERYSALRKNPELAQLPDSLLDELFGRMEF